jgi:signal transduction histidine kinase/DNA-binding response OmpR family regulator
MKNSILKVLLVDDDEDDYLITSDLIGEIERSRYELEWASNYDQALELIGQHRHDVYLIDYRLGSRNGLDLIKAAIEDGCAGPMILLTGQGDSEVDIMAMEAGAMDYLVKGQIDSSIIERTIRYAIQRKRSEDIQAALFKISEATNLSDNLEELLTTIHQVLGTLIDTTNFMVALYDEHKDAYSFPYIVDEHHQDMLILHSSKKSLSDYIRRQGKPLLINKGKYAELIAAGEVESSGPLPLVCLGVPLKTSQAVDGVVKVQSYTDQSLYSDADLDLLAFVSGHIAMAIERKRAEEEIKILAKFPTENPNPFLRVSMDGRILYANNASSGLLDMWRTNIGEYLPDKLKFRVADIFSAGRIHEQEFKFDDLEFLFTFTPSVEGGYITIYGQDVTERKSAELQRKILQEQLARAERMESLGILAGGVAHDLNNILGPLVAYPEIIKMKLPPDSKIRDEITKIEKSAQTASEVVQDLLTMARRGRYEMLPVNLNDVINSYLQSTDFLDLSQRYPDVELNTSLQDDLPVIHGSVPHLYKVILNLMLNSYEAMTGGGRMTIKTECRSIDRLSSGFANIEIGRYVIMTISDTGHGISRTDLKHLFEPFYTKKKMGTSGSGLGLAIVYGVIKDHNGYIDVKSELGRGTDFIAYFPIAVGCSSGREEKEAMLDTRGTEKVLVIDDLEDQRELAASVLSSLGYTVDTAASGQEAVEYLKQKDADILLLDMIMEDGFDGLQTYQEIIKFKPGQKAIIASGFSETERVKEAERLGVGKYIRKPYTMQILGKAIREVMESSTPAAKAPLRA